MPVSAKLKSTFPRVELASSLDTIRHTSLHPADQVAFLLAFAIAAVATAVLLGRRLAGRELAVSGRGGVFALLSLYVFGRLTFMALFSRADVQGSYAILAHVYVVLAWILATEVAVRWIQAGSGAGRVAALSATMLLVVSAALLAGKASALRSWYAGLEPGGRGDEVAFASAIHDATSPGDVIYGGAFGLTGFLADRAWINGDGVANSYEYQRVFLTNGLDRYLRENGVTHVIRFCDPTPREGVVTLEARSILYGRANPYHAEARPVVRWHSLRGGGAELCLCRYRPGP